MFSSDLGLRKSIYSHDIAQYSTVNIGNLDGPGGLALCMYSNYRFQFVVYYTSSKFSVWICNSR